MKHYKFIVEKTVDGYCAYNEAIDGSLSVTLGDTLTDLKANALEALNLTLEHQNKKTVNEDAIILVQDLKNFFAFYKIINTVQLAQRLKINRSLLSQYITGKKTPSPSQTKRILSEVKNWERAIRN